MNAVSAGRRAFGVLCLYLCPGLLCWARPGGRCTNLDGYALLCKYSTSTTGIQWLDFYIPFPSHVSALCSAKLLHVTRHMLCSTVRHMLPCSCYITQWPAVPVSPWLVVVCQFSQQAGSKIYVLAGSVPPESQYTSKAGVYAYQHNYHQRASCEWRSHSEALVGDL